MPKRALVTFIAKVRGTILKHFLGGLAPKSLSSSPIHLPTVSVTVMFTSSVKVHFIAPSMSPLSYHFVFICLHLKIQMMTKIKLMHSLITSMALYGCESWTFTKQLERRVNAFEQRCFRRLLGIACRYHRTDALIVEELTDKVGAYEPLLEVARRRKLQWFGHIIRQPGSLAHTIMHGSIKGIIQRGRPKLNWLRNIQEWTGLNIRVAENRERWKRLVTVSKFPNGLVAMGVT